MKPLIKVAAFIINSDSQELPKVVREAIIGIGITGNWRVGTLYPWTIRQPDLKDKDAFVNPINIYLLNKGVKLNNLVFIRF